MFLAPHKPTMLLCCLFFTFSMASAQSTGTWSLLNIKKKLNQRWTVFAETQLRSLSVYKDFHYYEYKAGMNYIIHPQVQLSLGLGKFMTYQEGGDFKQPVRNNEFRIWPQITFTHLFRQLKIEHRYRLESRFTSSGYRNRFRYRLGFTFALASASDPSSPILLGAANEIFFTDQEPYFERNRWLLTIERKLSHLVAIQIEYIRQLDYKINDETGRGFLQTGVYLHLQKKVPTSLPAQRELKDF